MNVLKNDYWLNISCNSIIDQSQPIEVLDTTNVGNLHTNCNGSMLSGDTFLKPGDPFTLSCLLECYAMAIATRYNHVLRNNGINELWLTINKMNTQFANHIYMTSI